MQIFKRLLRGGIFIADKSGEFTRLIIALGRRFNLGPSVSDNIHIQQIIFYLLADIWQQATKSGAPLSGGFRISQTGRYRMIGNRAFRIEHSRHHAEISGVVGNRLKIKRHANFHIKAKRVGDGFAFSKIISCIGAIAIAENKGIERQIGVQMGFAKHRAAIFRSGQSHIRHANGKRRTQHDEFFLNVHNVPPTAGIMPQADHQNKPCMACKTARRSAKIERGRA